MQLGSRIGPGEENGGQNTLVISLSEHFQMQEGKRKQLKTV